MEVKNCRDCGRLFNYIGGSRICPGCRTKLEEKFTEVKRYIDDNKDATVNMVAEEMEVSVKQIHQWIREERLAISDNSAIMIPCESCGGPIRTGRYCDKCRNNMASKLGEVYQKEEPQVKSERKERGRMRFLDN